MTALEENTTDAEGRILTFYSYKGGTGRSMALANVAWMLALNNNRVLAIDWDLEAPGLHRYFHPFLDDKELLNSRGLIDFAEDLASRSAASEEPLRDEEADVSSYVISLDREGWNWEKFGERAGIDLLPAGRQSAAYSTKVNSFNWIDFYQSLGGRRFLRYMASQLRTIYDYILIDSRTGVSDTAGICTVEMPDNVVVCFTLNQQSVQGAANICESMLAQRSMREEAESSGETVSAKSDEFRIYPVPTRVEIQSEYAKRQVALALVEKTFSKYLGNVNSSNAKRYWGSMQMQYVPFYAFEEIPAIFGDSPDDQLSICAMIGRLTTVLTNGRSVSLGALDEELRLRVLGWYHRVSETTQDPVQLVELVFQQFDADLQKQAIQVLLRLVQVTPRGEVPNIVDRDDLQSGLSDATDVLVKAEVVKLATTADGKTLQLSNPSLLQNWKRYREWVTSDLEFLRWRQSVNTAAGRWRLTNQRESDLLLRGALLEEAKLYQRERGADLNEDEKEFLAASREAEIRRRETEEQDRHARDSLKQEVLMLGEELTKAKSISGSNRKWYLSPLLFVAVLLGTVSAFWIVQSRRQSALQADSVKQNELQAERYSAMASELSAQNKQLQAELAVLRTEAAPTPYNGMSPLKRPAIANPDVAKKATLPQVPATSTKRSQSAKSGQGTGTRAGDGNLTNQPPTATFTCHIVPTTAEFTVPGEIIFSIAGAEAGSIQVGPSGTSGMNFRCVPGKQSVQMTQSGYGGSCSARIDVEAGATNFRIGLFHIANGIINGCRLDPVGPSSAK